MALVEVCDTRLFFSDLVVFFESQCDVKVLSGC